MKIIEQYQKDLIVCDNLLCEYKIPNPTGDPNAETSQYIDVNCPECGLPLLTKEDYELNKKFLSIVNGINKYFGWLAIFNFRNTYKKITVHVHKGINITEK